MKRAVLPLLGAGLLLATLTAHAQSFEIVNLTASGGGAFPVVTDLTFHNLAITETFADATTATVTLPGTDLSTADLFLDAGTTNPDPTHGAITAATLTGDIGGVTTISAQPTLDPASAYPLTVFSSTFTVNLAGSDPTYPFGSVSIGTFTLLDSTGTPVSDPAFSKPIQLATTPEPGVVALFAAGAVSLLATARRRARRA